MKKFIALFLSVLLICLCQISVYATEVRYTDTLLISALQTIEPSKDAYNLNNVNFADLEISNPINSYIYSDNGLIESNKYYPIFYNDELVLFAVKVENNDNSYFQITDSLVSIVNSYIDNSDEVSFVLDKNAIYLYDGSSFTELVFHGVNIEERNELNSSFLSYSDTQILKTNKLLSTPKKITYSSNMDRSSAVLQNFRKVGKNTPGYGPNTEVTYDESGSLTDNTYNLCWAACIASMVNYENQALNPGYLNYKNAVDIAKEHTGSSTAFNVTIQSPTIVLQSFGYFYNQYTIYNNNPQYVYIAYNNIFEGYPIYGHVDSHAVVIYGANLNGNYLSIMDPEGDGGLYTAYYDELPGQEEILEIQNRQNGYYYYNIIAGVYLTLTNSFSQYITS